MRRLLPILLLLAAVPAGAEPIPGVQSEPDALATPAALQACVAGTDQLRRCRLAPGRYDVGTGLTLTAGTSGVVGEVLVLELAGVEFYSTAADVTGPAVFNLDTSAMQGASIVHLVGPFVVGGSAADADEVAFRHVPTVEDAPTAQILRLEGIYSGQGLAGGSEIAVKLEDATAGGAGLTHVPITSLSGNVASGGDVLWIDGDASRVFTLHDLTVRGLGDSTAANNLCVHDVGTKGSPRHAQLIFDHVVLQACGGIDTDLRFTGNLVASNLGTPAEDAAIISGSWDGGVLDVTTSDWSTGSDGPLFQSDSTGLALDFRVFSDRCGTSSFLNASAPVLFEAPSTPIAMPYHINARIVGSANPDTCQWTAFGPNVLGALVTNQFSARFEGPTRVEEYQDSLTPRVRALGGQLQPVVTAKAGTATLAASECRNGPITNAGAGAAEVLTLPIADADVGLVCTVILAAAQDVDVQVEGSDGCTPGAGCEQILGGATSAPGRGLSSDASVGSLLSLQKVDATSWVPLATVGTWSDTP